MSRLDVLSLSIDCVLQVRSSTHMWDLSIFCHNTFYTQYAHMAMQLKVRNLLEVTSLDIGQKFIQYEIYDTSWKHGDCMRFMIQRLESMEVASYQLCVDPKFDNFRNLCWKRQKCHHANWSENWYQSKLVKNSKMRRKLFAQLLPHRK